METLGLDGRRINNLKEMTSFHQHQDIEINFLETGYYVICIGHAFYEVKAPCLLLFWASYPHKILKTSDDASMSWITVPLSMFLSWSLPQEYTEKVLTGEIIQDYRKAEKTGDEILLNRIFPNNEFQKINPLCITSS